MDGKTSRTLENAKHGDTISSFFAKTSEIDSERLGK